MRRSSQEAWQTHQNDTSHKHTEFLLFLWNQNRYIKDILPGNIREQLSNYSDHLIDAFSQSGKLYKYRFCSLLASALNYPDIFHLSILTLIDAIQNFSSHREETKVYSWRKFSGNICLSSIKMIHSGKQNHAHWGVSFQWWIRICLKWPHYKIIIMFPLWCMVCSIT